MLSQQHTADGDYEYDGRQQHSRLVVLQVALDKTVHHKDAVVYTDAKDKRGDDDADKVELHTKQVHHAQHEEPAQQNGSKAQESLLEVEME